MTKTLANVFLIAFHECQAASQAPLCLEGAKRCCPFLLTALNPNSLSTGASSYILKLHVDE